MNPQATKIWTNKFIFIIILILFYIILFKPTEGNIFSIHFVDEDDNFVTASLMLRGKLLYKDMFYQHQPLPSIISMGILKATTPNSLFLLVKRHRELIYFFSALSFLFLTLRFGYPGVIMAIIYDLSKFTLLGNLFLAETLVAMPILFIISYIYILLTNKKRVEFGKIDLFIAILSFLFILFTLLPLAPFLIISFLIIWSRIKRELKKWLPIYLILTTIISALLFSPLISFPDYIRQTVIINLTEYIPTQFTDPLPVVLFRIFLFPISIFFLPQGDFYWILKIVGILYLFSFIILLKNKNYRLPFAGFFLLATLNMRPLPFKLFYQGFHLLPLYAAFLYITLLQINQALSLVRNSVYKIAAGTITFGILISLFLSYGYKEYGRKSDQKTDWYINYSSFFDFGETIKILSDSTDKLLVIPSASLIYWQSGLLPSSPFFFTYQYMYGSKQLSQELVYHFQISPPEFLYFVDDLSQDKLFGKFARYYQQIFQNNKPSRLYINKEKINLILPEKWGEVGKYGFSQ